jgi:DNA-binding PadR family transcriptional regulator
MVRIYAQVHLDLLLLAVISTKPGDGTAVMRELREQSGGRFAPPSRTVYGALNHLERNRLIQRSYVEPRRYKLTDSGRRSLYTRRKEWESFETGMDAVLQRTKAGQRAG